MFGEWGVGKPAILGAVKAKLKDQKVGYALFDAWRYAKILNARGVMLVTAADCWNEKTKQLPKEAFAGIWPIVKLREGAERINS